MTAATRVPHLDKFQQRFTLPMIGLLALTLAGLSWLTAKQLSGTLGIDLRDKAIDGVRVLSKESRVGLLLGDKESLSRLVRRTKESDPSRVAVALFDAHGDVVVTTDSSLSKDVIRQLGYPLRTFREDIIQDTLIVRNPIFARTGEFLGMAIFQISRERIAQLVRQASLQLVVPTLGVFLGLAFFLNTLLNKVKILGEMEHRRAMDLEAAYKNLQTLQGQLVRSEKLAAIGQLASGVGHELRNPLGAINNAVYYIRDALKTSTLLIEDPTLGEFMDLAETEIKSATRIISDLLDFSRVVKLKLETTDLNASLKYMKGTLQIPATVEYVEEFAADLPTAMVDPDKMQQVFVNLAANAIQAMPKGGSLHIRTHTEQDPQNSHPWVHVDFVDTGEGMPPEVRERIFEPLYTTKAKGTGLGLPICQSIIQAHNGHIDIRTEVGKGSTFTIRIPTEGGTS